MSRLNRWTRRSRLPTLRYDEVVLGEFLAGLEGCLDQDDEVFIGPVPEKERRHLPEPRHVEIERETDGRGLDGFLMGHLTVHLAHANRVADLAAL